MGTFANSEEPDEMLHFIRSALFLKVKKDKSSDKRIHFFSNYNPTPLVLFCLILYVPVNNLSVTSGQVFQG